MRLATFNVTNLNAVGQAFLARPDSLPYDDDRFSKKTENIVDVLNALNADIVGFQEVFSEQALRSIVQKSEHLKQAHVVAPDAQMREIDGVPTGIGPAVGLATHYNVKTRHDIIVDFPKGTYLLVPTGRHGAPGEIHHLPLTTFERGVLRVDLHVPGLGPQSDEELTVFVAHLKSKRPRFLPSETDFDDLNYSVGRMRSLMVRAAEATALRMLVTNARKERLPSGRRRPVVVLGDLNDDKDAVTTEMIVGERPFSRYGNLWPSQYVYGTQDLMLPAYEVKPPVGDPYTYVFSGKGSVLDLILVSSDFFGHGADRIATIKETGVLRDFLKYKPTPRYTVQPINLKNEPDTQDEADEDLIETLTDGPNDDDTRAPPTHLDHGVPFADIEPVESLKTWEDFVEADGQLWSD